MSSTRSSAFYYKHGMIAEAREARKRERPQIRQSERSYNDDLREKIFDLYGRKCGICGFNEDLRILQLDHKNGGGNQERRQIGTRGIRRNALRNPEAYQLLCPNCNWTKRYNLDEQNKPKDN